MKRQRQEGGRTAVADTKERRLVKGSAWDRRLPTACGSDDRSSPSNFLARAVDGSLRQMNAFKPLGIENRLLLDGAVQVLNTAD